MPAGVDPVADSGIARGRDNPQTAIGFETRGMFVDRDLRETIVEAFHPPVVELKIPIRAFRRHHLDEPCFVRIQLPIGMGVEQVLCATGFLVDLLIERAKFIGIFGKHSRPVGEGIGHPFYKLGGGSEAAFKRFRRDRCRAVRTINPFYAELAGLFGDAIQ